MQKTGLIPPGQTTGALSTLKCNWIQSRFTYGPENYKVPHFGLETHPCKSGGYSFPAVPQSRSLLCPPLLFKKGKRHQVFWWVESSSKFSIPSLKTACSVTQHKPMQSRARREVIMIHTFFFPFKKQTLLYWHNIPETVFNAVTDRYRGRTMHPHFCTKQTSFWSLSSRLSDL